MCVAALARWLVQWLVNAFKVERWRAGFYTAGETPALPVTPARPEGAPRDPSFNTALLLGIMIAMGLVLVVLL